MMHRTLCTFLRRQALGTRRTYLCTTTTTLSSSSSIIRTTTTASVAPASASASAAAALYSCRRTLFTNKATRDPTADPNAGNFFDKKVESEKEILAARKAEAQLPSKQQLEEELPTGEELEKALKEGRMDQFATETSDTTVDD